MPFRFDTPIWLAALPFALALLAWAHWQSRSGADARTRRIALGLRLCTVLALIVTLAGVHIPLISNSTTTFFLVDCSHSITPEQRQNEEQYCNAALAALPAGDEAGIIVFGGSATVVQQPTDANKSVHLPDQLVDEGTTDIARAVQLAEASFPRNSRHRIVLVSDGNENKGAVAETIASLAAHDTPIFTAAPMVGRTKRLLDISVTDLALPNQVREQEPVMVRANIQSNAAQTATATLDVDGVPAQTQRLKLATGTTPVQFSAPASSRGLHRYDVSVAAPADAVLENDRQYGYVMSKGRPVVLYATDSPADAQPLQAALAAQGVSLSVHAPYDLPTNGTAYLGFDSVVLSNVPAGELSAIQMQTLRDAVRETGLGLTMVGGVNAFAPGGYLGTPVEDALPVIMADRIKEQRVPMALAIVMEDLEAPGRVNISIEAAKGLARSLKPTDLIGVLDCNGVWRIPFQPASNPAALAAQMDHLTQMNDPAEYDTYLKQAGTALLQQKGRSRHMIFIGDGDEVPPSAAMLQQLHAQGITVSTIAAGADPAGVRAMAGIAAAGGGAAYNAADDNDLPKILLQDQKVYAHQLFEERAATPRVAQAADVLDGVPWPNCPPLLGNDITTPKPGSETLLTIGKYADPVYARWQFGAGRSVAWTSDDHGHWAAPWMLWSGYGRVWTQMMRWVGRSASSDALQCQTHSSHGSVVLTAALRDHAASAAPAQVTANLVRPNRPPESITLHADGTGTYTASFDAGEPGSTIITLHAQWNNNGKLRTASQTTTWVTSYSPEYNDLPPNTLLLEELAQGTGGSSNAPPEHVLFKQAPRTVGDWNPAPALLAAMTVMFLLDIAARRLGWGFWNRRRPAESVIPAHVVAASNKAARVRRRASSEAPMDQPSQPAPSDDAFPAVARLKKPPSNPGS